MKFRHLMIGRVYLTTCWNCLNLSGFQPTDSEAETVETPFFWPFPCLVCLVWVAAKSYNFQNSSTTSRPEDMGNGTFAMSDSRAYKEFTDVDLPLVGWKNGDQQSHLGHVSEKHSHAYFVEKGPKEKKALIFCVHLLECLGRTYM